MSKVEIRTTIKPWGKEELWASTEAYAGKVITIESGKRLSLQYHETKEETVLVLRGTLLVWTSEDHEQELPERYEEGEAYHVVPGDVHRFGAPAVQCDKSNSKFEGCILLEVSTNHLNDVVRISDDYKR